MTESKTPGVSAIHPPDVPEPPAEGEEMDATIWRKCDGCGELVHIPQLANHLQVCYLCDHHFPIPSLERLSAIVDADSFVEVDDDLSSLDPLEFVDSKPYTDRLEAARAKTGRLEGFVSGSATIDGREVEIGTFDFAFLGGSMGSVVGEKVARLFERARDHRHCAIVICQSGGARMQEGLLSLMQMAKTCAALSALRDVGVPYIAVLVHPTTGGVAASFGMLGDVTVAEPGALIGFAGPRVIEQTIRQKLPEGFQRSEYLLDHGMLDRIVDRRQLREELSRLVGLLTD